MFVLRKYQQEAVDKGLEFFTTETKYTGAIEVLPTGSGKSLVIANIAMCLPGKTIVLQPSKEILEQNYAKLKAYDIDDVSMYSASAGEKIVSKITLCTIGSIINKIHLFKDFDHIIIDECHLVNHKGGQYKKFIEAIGVKVLGLTATPYRLTTYGMGSMLKFITRVQKGIFQKVIHVTQISEIEQEGFLSKMEYFVVNAIDPSKLESNTTGTDYTDRSLLRHYTEIGMNEKTVNVVKRLAKAGRKHILVFSSFLSDCETIAKQLLTDMSCEMVSGETPKKDRERILRMFKNGDIQCVLNVGVLTTGFDFPELDTVVIARPTKSLGLYYQIVGRGMRPHPSKESCRVIDMARTKEIFGEVSKLQLVDPTGRGGRVVKAHGRKAITNVFM